MVSLLSLLPPLLLLGCGAGSYESTLIQDLRVLQIEADPPEAQPGERVSATIHVANPDGFEVEVMFWTCFMVDGSCIEADYAEELEQWVTLGTLAEHEVVVARDIPSELWELLDELGGSASVHMAALACEVGQCPIFDEVRLGMDGRGVPADIVKQLSDPDPWMRELPMDVVALSGRAFPVTERDPNGRNDNPELDARFAEALDDPMVLPAGADVDFSFWAADPDGETIYAYPLTTAGSFEERKVKVDDEEVRLWLRTPDEPTEATAWVIFDDRDGGLAVWRRDFVVR